MTDTAKYPLLGTLRIVGLLAWTFLMMPIHMVCCLFGNSVMRYSAQVWHIGVCWIAGIRIQTSGQIYTKGPVMYVCNHGSYVDIVVLGALLKACFVSKQDVSSWPGLGLIAKLGGTVFVARQRMRTKGESNEITETLMNKGRLIIFPEAGTNDGNRVLPFKSALLAPAESNIEGRPVTVQPIAITYSQINGLPIDRQSRPAVAWYGDMYLVPHLWDFVQLGRVVISVDCLPHVTNDVLSSRKELARHCEHVIRDTTARRRSEGLSHADVNTPRYKPQDPQLLNI